MRQYLGILFAVLLLVTPWFAYNHPTETEAIASAIGRLGGQFASVVLSRNPKTVEEIRSRYDTTKPRLFRQAPPKVRMLIVPGHEPDYGGAEYGSLKERNMTVELANYLTEYLLASDLYQVYVTRNADSWHPIFDDYFKSHKDAILSWQRAYKEDFTNLTRLGKVKPVTPAVFHNTAPDAVALRLYGIDKWSNENDIDIAIHIHFNDYPRRDHSVPGKYSGFTIYVPEKQYWNSTTTHALADSIFDRLERYNPVSDLPGEDSGIVEDQDLIAVGSYNSVNAASMLIEYGYIYEPQFADPQVRSAVLRDLAYQTYVGLEDFLVARDAKVQPNTLGTAMIPYEWPVVSDSAPNSTDIYALQTALLIEGLYPPKAKTKNECPRTGRIGPCTKAAMASFQDRYSIEGERDRMGPKTIHALNELYGH